MISKEKPLVSVLLPVLNGEEYIKLSMDSILEQTYSHIELIVLVDPSQDKTLEAVKSIKDRRIRIVADIVKAGLPASLNKGIQLAKGKYIARQDHDDISLPTRIEKQVAFLEENGDYAIVGTHSKILEGNKPTDRGHLHPADYAHLRFLTIFNAYFVHGSVMIRKSALDDIGMYPEDPSRSPPEDFELWSRINRRYKMGNLSEPLYLYREISSSITRTVNFDQQFINICSENIALELNSPITFIHRAIPALMLNKPELAEGNINFLKIKKIINQIAHKIESQHQNRGVDELRKKFLDDLAIKYSIFCCNKSVLNRMYLKLSKI